LVSPTFMPLECKMSAPSCATLLSRFLLFSLLTACFWATSAAAKPTNGFTKLERPVKLPDILVYCPNTRPANLTQAFKARAQGKPVLLHLWAPFCKACGPEMKAIDAQHRRLTDEGLVIMTLAEDPHGNITVPAFGKRNGILSLELCYDPLGTVIAPAKNPVLPTTYLVAPDGQVLAVHEGPMAWDSLSLK